MKFSEKNRFSFRCISNVDIELEFFLIELSSLSAYKAAVSIYVSLVVSSTVSVSL
jgi:hypothetical protein